MKHRTKLYLYMSGTAVFSSLIGFVVLLKEFREHLFADQQLKAMTVAATTAAMIDPELFKQINTREDEHSPLYREIKKLLIRVRDANRRPDIRVYFIYTLKPDPNHPGRYIYVVDAEEDPAWVSHYGDPVVSISITHLDQHLNEIYSPHRFITDWGDWTTGYAPIYDKDGKYVATVGVDISISRFYEFYNEMVQNVIIAIVVSLIFAFIGGSWLAKQMSSSLNALLSCVKEIGAGNLNSTTSLNTRDEFGELATEINNMTAGLRERERLKLNFARYVSYQIMEKVLKEEEIAKLTGERRKITVLFSDIRQFTAIAESLPPEQVVSLLDDYFGVMVEVIFRHHGTLDKFLGDGIMVEFGVPLDDPVQEQHAVMAAIDMQKGLKKLVERWKMEGKPEIEIGIGVHTGLAIVGNIGTEKRFDYTAIGDTVNIAASLEQTTKLLKKPILISETTYNAIKSMFKAISMGPMLLPGRKDSITIYSIEIEEST
jgi:adenylate cyclase